MLLTDCYITCEDKHTISTAQCWMDDSTSAGTSKHREGDVRCMFQRPHSELPHKCRGKQPPPTLQKKKKPRRPDSNRPAFDSINITEKLRAFTAISANYIRRVVKQFANGSLITSFRRTTPSPQASVMIYWEFTTALKPLTRQEIMDQATPAIAGLDIKPDTPIFHPAILRLVLIYRPIFFSLHSKIIFFKWSVQQAFFLFSLFPLHYCRPH